MKLFIGIVGLVAALLVFIATIIVIIMLHEQKEEQQKEKADNKEEFRQILKQALKPLERELEDLLLMVDVLAKGTFALMEHVEYTLDEECKDEKRWDN